MSQRGKPLLGLLHLRHYAKGKQINTVSRHEIGTPAQRSVKPANSEVVDTEHVIYVSPARNHMESEPGFGFREKSMKR